MTPKLTFAESFKEAETQKNNSDLSNLAQACIFIRHRLQELDMLQTEIESTALKIENGGIVDVKVVRDLYNRARGDKSL